MPLFPGSVAAHASLLKAHGTWVLSFLRVTVRGEHAKDAWRDRFQAKPNYVDTRYQTPVKIEGMQSIPNK